MSEEEARKRQIEAARATREYAPVMAQEITVSEHTALTIHEDFNGDWRIRDTHHIATINSNRKEYAVLFAAAPKLLVALEALIAAEATGRMIDKSGGSRSSLSDWQTQFDAGMKLAREAIKEARDG